MRQLDGLRGMAAVAVLVWHYAWEVHPALLDTGNEGLAYAAFRQVGRNAVFWFFVLSGFLVGGPFVRWLLSGRHGEPRPQLRRYGLTRVIRILPLWWLVLTAVLLLDQPSRVTSATDVALLALLQHNFDPTMVREVVGPAWTLSVELWFYVTLPIAALLLRPVLVRLHPTARLAALVALLTAVTMAVAHARELRFDGTFWQPHATDWQSWSLVAFADMFALGMLVALGCHLVERHRVELPAWSTPLLVGCGVGTYLVALQLRQELGGYGPTIVAASCALVLAALVLAPASLPSRMLAVRPLAYLGTISYGLYLWHMPVAFAAGSVGWLQATPDGTAAITQVLGGALVSLALAAASWHLLESRALRWAKRLPLRPARPGAYGTPAMELPTPSSRRPLSTPTAGGRSTVPAAREPAREPATLP